MLLKYGFRWKKPILMLRLVKYFFMVKVLRQKRLKYIDVAFNYACNRNCQYCFAKNLMKVKKKKMTLAEHKRFCKEAMKLGAYHFDFQGGEPLLNYEELKTLIKIYQPKKNFISITTNGVLVDSLKIDELKKLGIDLIILSVNNKMDLTIAGFIKSLGVNVVLNFVISKKSLRSKLFRGIILFAKKAEMLVNCLFAVSVGGWEDKGVLLGEEDKQLFKFYQEGFPSLRRDTEANFGGQGCGAVKESLYLTSYGDVFACPFIHKSLGNVKEESLKKIREKGLQIPCFAVYYPKCIVAEDREVLNEIHIST